MTIVKSGSAKYEGLGKSGKGHVSSESGALSDQPYGFNTRFEGEPGTNPGELIGAAHAACYAMAMSLGLGDAGLKADAIDVRSTVGLDQVPGGFEIKKIHLTVEAKIPDATDAQFQEIAQATKEGCPVSKVLKGAEITMEAKLV